MKRFSSLISSTLFLGLAACGGGPGGGNFMDSIKSTLSFSDTHVWLETVYFEVDENLNNDAPVTVNIVIAHNEKLLNNLLTMTASQYFEKKEQIQRDNAADLDIYHYDIIPGQVLGANTIKPKKSTGKGIIVFARYASNGDHRQRIGSDRAVTIQMGPKDFQIVPFEDPKNEPN